ncbi:MAG: DNA mismatch repair endonuclease MutL [Spirochaetia bacterium]|nr:DNA mismatch repair endonuclease MutL [Spirochaetia bacterium]
MKQNNIKILEPLVAQRIAAGEVIDRPASIVRELVDNAIDAGSNTISVELIDGGIERIRVVDDGCGIPQEDLALTAHSHATSKVSEIEDLESLSTLGFRGEALYSIAAGAVLTIQSTTKGEMGSHITFDNGKRGEVIPGGPSKGTVVEVKDLFAHIPARRLFLKTGASEARMAKLALIEKALPFPNLSFYMSHNGSPTLELPQTTPKNRVLDILKTHKEIIASCVIEMSYSAASFSLYAVATNAEVYRNDRKYINIFVNNRIIDEYALTQAVTYGYDPFLPGGAYPYCYLFITVDPKLVDFNIHPAKREVKLRNKAEIHHSVVSMIKQFLNLPTVQKTEHYASSKELFDQSPRNYQIVSNFHSSYRKEKGEVEPDWFNRAKQVLQKQQDEKKEESISIVHDIEFKYLGQLFSLFLLVEKDSSLFLIDQHAAHERILYDELKTVKGSQPLMIELDFEVERSIDTFLLENSEWYKEFGITIIRKGDLQWALTSIVPHYKLVEEDIIRSIQGYSGGNIEELHKMLYANTACKAAIKDGDIIDDDSAIALIKKVFALTYPVCPHGRNFVVEITRDQLFNTVGRIV